MMDIVGGRMIGIYPVLWLPLAFLIVAALGGGDEWLRKLMVWMSYSKLRQWIVAWSLDFVRLASLVIIAIAGHSLCGYVTHQERMYRWLEYGDVGMALNTSIEFVLVGVCLFLMVNHLREKTSG